MQKVVERARGHAEMRWQPAVEGVGHLIEVVADPPQLREQGGIQAMENGFGHLDLDPFGEETPLAVGGDLESELYGGERQPLVVGVAHADVDLTVATLRVSRRYSRHVTPLKGWVRDAGTAS